MRVAGVAKASRNDTSDKANSTYQPNRGPQSEPKMLQTKQATLPQDAAIDCGSNTM